MNIDNVTEYTIDSVTMEIVSVFIETAQIWVFARQTFFAIA